MSIVLTFILVAMAAATMHLTTRYHRSSNLMGNFQQVILSSVMLKLILKYGDPQPKLQGILQQP